MYLSTYYVYKNVELQYIYITETISPKKQPVHRAWVSATVNIDSHVQGTEKIIVGYGSLLQSDSLEVEQQGGSRIANVEFNRTVYSYKY